MEPTINFGEEQNALVNHLHALKTSTIINSTDFVSCRTQYKSVLSLYGVGGEGDIFQAEPF